MKFNLKPVMEPIQKVMSVAKQNGPDILFGIGLLSSVGACVECVKATPKAEKLIAEANAETVPEKVAVAWKPYILPLALEVTSIGCLLMSRKMTIEKLAALGGAYSASSAALKKAEEQLKEKLPTEEYVDAKKDILEEQAKVVPSVSEKGFLCHEQFTGRMFRATPDELRYIQIETIARMLDEKRYSDDDEGFVDLDYILKKFFKDEDYDCYVGSHTRIMYDRMTAPFDYTAAYYDEKYGEFVVDIIYTMSNVEQLA